MCRMRKATRDVRGNRGCHARASGHPVTGGRAIRAGAALLGTGRRLLDRPPARTMTAGGLGDVQVGASARVAATLPYALPPPPTPPHKGEGSRPSARQRSTTQQKSRVSRSRRCQAWPDGGRRILRDASLRDALRMRRRDHRRRGALTSARVSSSRASPSRRRSAATCRNARRSATSRRRP